MKKAAWLLLGLGLFGFFEMKAADEPTLTYQLLMRDILINADLWTDQPEILSANYAFENIIGVPGSEEEVREAGGTWNHILTCLGGTTPPRRVLTSSAQPQSVAITYGYPVYFADALPVVFSWPILPSTLNATDFQLTLNTGEIVTPEVVSINPNFEYNERHVAVIFGEFGNRLLPGEDGAIYVDTVEIVDDGTPLMLVGPDGPVSAVGLSVPSANPYVQGNGPSLVAAKLSRTSTAGEGAPLFLSGTLPNDGIALFGEEAAYRLRVYTSGGFSPDGVLGVRPDQFALFFRLHATNEADDPVLLTETNVSYDLGDGIVTVLGIADVGLKEGSDDGNGGTVFYGDCYNEDHDNYFDIMLAGDEVAVRRVTHVEIPAANGYLPFYNPGGPGQEPTPGVTYTVPGPSDLQPVTLALDDPQTVTYYVDSTGSESLGPDQEAVGGFTLSDWLGFFYDGNDPWLWSVDLGWIYPEGNDVVSLWIWSSTQGWLWTVRSTYPWLWSNELGAWFQVQRGTGSAINADNDVTVSFY